MDLEDAAALCVCARGEKERLEGQHERIWLVASGRWCLAMRRSQQERQRQQACARKERERERAVSTLGRRARVEHHSASRGGIACHAGRGEGSASGGSFLCVSCAAALCVRVGVRCTSQRNAQLFTHQVCFRDPPIAHYFLLTQDFFEVEGEIPLHPLSLSETTALHYDSFCEDDVLRGTVRQASKTEGT